MKPLATLLTLAALATGTAHAAAPTTGIHYGEARTLGAGTARAYVAIDVDGSACSFGVSIDEAAMKVKGNAAPEAVLPLPRDIALSGFANSGAAPVPPTFRVRYDRASHTYLVMLDATVAATASNAAHRTTAVAR